MLSETLGKRFVQALLLLLFNTATPAVSFKGLLEREPITRDACVFSRNCFTPGLYHESLSAIFGIQRSFLRNLGKFVGSKRFHRGQGKEIS